MRSIDSDLKSRQFKHVYLLYGEEGYLVRRYRQALVRALAPEADEMNFTRFRDREFDEAALIETANTMPFFAEYRVILSEDTGIFEKKSDALSKFFDEIPETAYLIFTEKKVDARKALFKKVQKVGDAEEMKRPDEKALERWMIGRVKKAGLNITRSAWSNFLERSGDSMDNMSNEMDKLLAYCEGKDAIRDEDVEAICMNWIEGKIFDLMEAIAAKDAKTVMRLYRDMLLMREEPLRILSVMRTQFLRLLLLKEMDKRREQDAEISKQTKIPRFFLGKNRQLARNFSAEDLSGLLIEAGNLEADVKTGRINPQIGLEMLMTRYAA